MNLNYRATKNELIFSPPLNELDSKLSKLQEQLSGRVNEHLELQIIEGLKLKGFVFDDVSDLRRFISENCTCAEDLINKRKIYCVGSMPFLRHEYGRTDLTNLLNGDNEIAVNFGSFVFV